MYSIFKKHKKIAFSLFLFASLASVSHSQEATVRGRLGISQNSFTTLWSGGDIKTNYQSLNAGATYIMSSGWYVDGGVKSALSAKWNSIEAAGDTIDRSFKRNDYTLTVGKSLSDNWQLFGGYQNSQSSMAISTTSPPEEKFSVKGYFVGVGKTIPVAVGSINLNASVGSMKGHLVDASGYGNNSNGGSGSSYGVSYSYPLSDKTSLAFDYKQQSYKYNFDSSSPLTSGKDKMSMIGASFSYQF